MVKMLYSIDVLVRGGVSCSLDNNGARRRTHRGVHSRIYPRIDMSAILTPDGIMTHQEPGEVYGKAEQGEVDALPEPLRTEAHENFMTGQYINRIYDGLMASDMGRNFVGYMRRVGNGEPDTGSIEDIYVESGGRGNVAATIPDAARRNLIVYADDLDCFCNRISNLYDMLSYDDIAAVVIMHELFHNYGQTKEQRTAPVEQIEFHNDYNLINFFINEANNNPNQREYFRQMAKVVTERYSISDRAQLQNYIDDQIGYEQQEYEMEESELRGQLGEELGEDQLKYSSRPEELGEAEELETCLADESLD